MHLSNPVARLPMLAERRPSAAQTTPIRIPAPDLDALPLRVTLSNLSGEALVRGRLTVRPQRSAAPIATLASLDRPGALARAYFAGGLRDVVLELGDGSRTRARITGSRFSPGGGRAWELRMAQGFV